MSALEGRLASVEDLIKGLVAEYGTLDTVDRERRAVAIHREFMNLAEDKYGLDDQQRVRYTRALKTLLETGFGIDVTNVDPIPERQTLE